MIVVIGVKFRKSGKVYYFDPIGLSIQKGSHVIVETARGIEYGTVVIPPKQITDDQLTQPLKPIIRMATSEDDQKAIENEEKEQEAYTICKKKIREHELEMKLIDSEYTFDRNKLLFYFSADGRIDFRELVKDLASVFHTRIELRQIGVRDETKLIGGLGICGRPLCCHTYLTDFVPVSIKMAKEQNLSLNPAKISGVCGRLMCCLKNEQEAYEDLNRNLPKIGAKVSTNDGLQGEVQSVSVLRQLVKVLIDHDDDEREIKEYPVSDLSFQSKYHVDTSLSELEEIEEAKELIDLEALEQESQIVDTPSENTNKQNKHKNRNRKNQKTNTARDLKSSENKEHFGRFERSRGYKADHSPHDKKHRDFQPQSSQHKEYKNREHSSRPNTGNRNRNRKNNNTEES